VVAMGGAEDDWNNINNTGVMGLGPEQE